MTSEEVANSIRKCSMDLDNLLWVHTQDNTGMKRIWDWKSRNIDEAVGYLFDLSLFGISIDEVAIVGHCLLFFVNYNEDGSTNITDLVIEAFCEVFA